MTRLKGARLKAVEFRADVVDIFVDALENLKHELSGGADTVDVTTAIGAELAKSLCSIVHALPKLAGVSDNVEDIRYGGSMAGLSIEGKSKRSAARFDWYFGLHGGVVFSTTLSNYELILRCTDQFWGEITALSVCGTLSYEERQSFHSEFPKQTRRKLEVSRSAVFNLARDLVLAALDEDGRQKDFGAIAVSWPLDTDASNIVDGMCEAMRRYNALNQLVHRISYLDAKGREARKSRKK